MKHKCPICKGETDSAVHADFPFCSERCRILDLGNWASEKYKISSPAVDESEPDEDALRSLDLAKPGFSKNGFLTDGDLSIEWGFIQQQTKKTNVPVSIAYDMTLLREVQRELGM